MCVTADELHSPHILVVVPGIAIWRTLHRGQHCNFFREEAKSPRQIGVELNGVVQPPVRCLEVKFMAAEHGAIEGPPRP